MLFPCSVFSPADPKVLSEDTNKCQSLSSLLATQELHTQLFHFSFQLFGSADKNYDDDTLVNLVLPPHPPPRECKGLIIF
jgi:hypothetical protein